MTHRISPSEPRALAGLPGWVLPLLSSIILAGCGGASTPSTVDASGGDGGVTLVGIDPASFLPGAFASGTTITTEPCTLSGGTATTCYRVTVTGVPGTDHTVGPFCPRNIADGAAAGGLWIESGVAYDLTGAFIANLANFYNDPAWRLYDATTGAIHVTDTEVGCRAAARPDVDPAYNNYCVECSLSYLTGGGVTSTYLLPTTPVALARDAEIGRMGGIGVALNGVPFEAPAPTQAILAAHTIAAFDDCGGHINPNAGYHYHAATGCSHEVTQPDAHAPLIGYAMDGYGMYAMLDGDGTEPGDLDACRGHTDHIRGFHYHVASAGENMFIGCFHGEQGRVQ